MPAWRSAACLLCRVLNRSYRTETETEIEQESAYI